MTNELEKDKLEDITGSGIPITIKGKEYKLGVFGIRDLADFRQYLKGQRIKIIQDTLQYDNEDIRKKKIEIIEKGVPGDSTEAKGERLRLVTNIINDYETDRIKIINNILDSNINEFKELETIDGICFMLWKSLQKYQPEMTLKEADDLVDLNNVKEISNIITSIGGKPKNSKKAKANP